MYLVSYIGIYLYNDGDHSFYLFDTEEDAKKRFMEMIAETKDFYEKELRKDPEYFEDNIEDGLFSLRTTTDSVDIHWQPIECDGKIYSVVY